MDEECLLNLLASEDTRDLILDDEALLKAVLEQPCWLKISSHLYFYILVRQVFLRSGIGDRSVADYVAEMLSEYSREEQTRCVIRGEEKPLIYFVDMLAALQEADERTSFEIRAHMGNYSLFMTGVFPDRVRWRTERKGAPGLSYYENMGRSSFRVARDHALARRFNLDSVFDVLSERFGVTRRALNQLSETLVSLGDPDCSAGLKQFE